jgi:DnaJ-class molecular chaperone
MEKKTKKRKKKAGIDPRIEYSLKCINDDPENFYGVLGIKDEKASKEDINSAFRFLALFYHPDKRSPYSSEINMGKIGTAHSVLTSYGGREQYDNERIMIKSVETNVVGGKEFSTTKCKTYIARVHLTMDDVFTGGVARVVGNLQRVCKSCSGIGCESGTIETCKKCEGTCGHINTISNMWGPGDGEAQFTTHCMECRATGIQVVNKSGKRCDECEGIGYYRVEVAEDVKYPAGIPSVGYSVILPGKGEQFPGKEPGDLMVHFHVDWDSRLMQRTRNDITMEIQVTLSEALCGFRHKSNFFGTILCIEKDGVINTGDTLLLKGMGIPHFDPYSTTTTKTKGRGDVLVKFRVMMPPSVDHLSEEAKRTLKITLDTFFPSK